MRWRNQNNNTNRNNQTLDSFFSGLSNTSSNSSSRRNSNITPKIKVPRSSGLQPIVKPIQSPFMYPQYPQFRQYQYSISIKCVTQNTLVCLPTGLGKTHIASVMMLNFHLWFPDGLIFFLAPTKPLVDQQSMCLANFRQYVQPNNIVSITGSVQPVKRVKLYENKRIFYCTPQTLENDLRQGRLNPKKIILIIFDEAHKSVGGYAYANIVKILDKQNFGYRIIGLSATPGNDHDKIQDVLQNLQISNMIVKSQDDDDVKKYIKKKNIQPIFIQSTQVIREVQKILQQFISWPLNQLLKFRLFDKNLAGGRYGFNPKCFYLINQQITQRLTSIPVKFVPIIQSTKCFLKFLADSQSLLRQSGYQSFKRKFLYQIDDASSQDRQHFMDKMFPQKQKIHQNFVKIIREHVGYKRIKQLFKGNTNACSHPKLQKLRNVLFQFLSKQQNVKMKSKVIVFANLRFTCHQIHKYLSQPPFGSIIKSQIFLGQSKTTVQTRDGDNSITQTLHLSQKQQINLIKRYKANQLNTLISTSIGEEGLDIGEVDAIFCYEGGMSTIRMVQRMGRTGRKRDGTVYVLLMDGKQSQDYERANKKTQRMKKTNSKKYKYFSYNPVLFQQFQQIPIKFFDKPEQNNQFKKSATSQNNTKTQQQTPKQTNTKRKKNKQNKNNDKKKTKKKTTQQQTRIQQATNSQQCDKQQNNNDNSNLTQQYEINYNSESIINKNKYFNIVEHRYIKPNWNDSDTSMDGQQKQQQQNKSYNPYQFTTHQNYTDSYYEQYYDGQWSKDQLQVSETGQISYKSIPQNQNFNKLFDFRQILQNQKHKQQQTQKHETTNINNQDTITQYIQNNQEFDNLQKISKIVNQNKKLQQIQTKNYSFQVQKQYQNLNADQQQIYNLQKNEEQISNYSGHFQIQQIENQNQKQDSQQSQRKPESEDDDMFNQIFEQLSKMKDKLDKNVGQTPFSLISDRNIQKFYQNSDDSSQLIDQHEQIQKQEPGDEQN